MNSNKKHWWSGFERNLISLTRNGQFEGWISRNTSCSFFTISVLVIEGEITFAANLVFFVLCSTSQTFPNAPHPSIIICEKSSNCVSITFGLTFFGFEFEAKLTSDDFMFNFGLSWIFSLSRFSDFGVAFQSLCTFLVNVIFGNFFLEDANIYDP